MELARGKELAEERNATMKDTIKISKQKLYEYVENFFDTIKADPEIYYNKLKRRLQEIGKDRFFEEMARIKTAPARIKKRKEEIAAAKSDEEKRVYREFGKLDEFEFQLFERQDFFLLSYHLLEMWTTQYYMVIQENGLDPERLQQLVFERAAEWFEPPAGWTYKDAEAALEPLRKQGEAFDEMLVPRGPYALILNSNVTNDLREIGGPRTKKIKPIEVLDKYKNVHCIGKVTTTSQAEFVLDNFIKTGGLNPKTCKIFDMCIQDVTERIDQSKRNIHDDPKIADKTVIISLKKYMERTKITDPKTAREQLADATERLLAISVTYKQKQGKDTPYFFNGDNLVQRATYTRGKAIILLSDPLWMYLKDHSYPMPFNNKAYEINDHKYPNAYGFATKIFAHHNMNITKQNANRIGVSTLLRSAQSIPSYEEVMQSDRHFDKRIRTPFERDLDALMRPEYGILESWEYCNAKGEPLADEQIDLKNYDVFSQLLINFKLKDYPDQTERIKKMQAAKKSHRPRAKAR